MIFFNGQTLEEGGGVILCPTTTEDNWIKIKTIFNLNTIPIAVIITPGPTVPSHMILVMVY